MLTRNVTKKLMLMTGMILVTTLSLAQQDKYVTRLIESPLDDVNIGSNTVVIQGRQYKYRPDPGKSMAYLDEDASKALSIRDLKKGETYMIEMYSDKDVPELTDFKQVILIAKEKPAE